MIALKLRIEAALRASPGRFFTAEEAAAAARGDPETAFKILEHLAANGVVRKQPREPWHLSAYGAGGP